MSIWKCGMMKYKIPPSGMSFKPIWIKSEDESLTTFITNSIISNQYLIIAKFIDHQYMFNQELEVRQAKVWI